MASRGSTLFTCALLGAVLAGCGGGSSSPSDAGPDAPASDAGRPDAEPPDGAMPDASSVDAGDATVADAGPGACAAELCDAEHLGSDDDCDGAVDEGCACTPGTSSGCFRGDPALRDAPGCFDGVETCGESGAFGACVGGAHAVDGCATPDPSACHAIQALPYATVDLDTGLGAFGADAVPGSETWTVSCPVGATCPATRGASGSSFHPLQSGEYIVRYGKDTASGPQECTYSLFVRGLGLRVELMWEHEGVGGVDLDLHLHRPANVEPWALRGASAADCGWANCGASAFAPPASLTSPDWFADPPASPPDAVNWALDRLGFNTCYGAPDGTSWSALGMGCHSPRLDSNRTSCDPSVDDGESPLFCLAENTNIDYPPLGQWLRIGVYDYDAHGVTTDVHPIVRIFCDGAQSAELGPNGYYTPGAPVAFSPADGGGASGNRFWEVADVAFLSSPTGSLRCVVKPLYADVASRTPLFTTDTAAELAFTPAYPPAP